MKYLSIENELNYSKRRYEFTKEIESIFVQNNYVQIKPSIFEDYDNFKAMNSRIPTKSMVKIAGDRILVLRPDITTSIIKSLIPRWEDDLVLKLFYHLLSVLFFFSPKLQKLIRKIYIVFCQFLY